MEIIEIKVFYMTRNTDELKHARTWLSGNTCVKNFVGLRFLQIVESWAEINEQRT